MLTYGDTLFFFYIHLAVTCPPLKRVPFAGVSPDSCSIPIWCVPSHAPVDTMEQERNIVQEKGGSLGKTSIVKVKDVLLLWPL